MKELFIPEIGTEITLAEDWEFTIFVEKRNETLFNALGYSYSDKYKFWSIGSNVYIPEFIYTDNEDFRVRFENWEKEIQKGISKQGNRTSYNIELISKATNDLKIFINESETITTNIKNIIPKNSTLIIDRIYIRKNKEEFSSVSFYWKDKPLGKEFKKYVRFWAKLEDVNKIKFEDNNE